MFVQIIKGFVTDPDHFQRQNQRWLDELKPGADGYLGCTWGITPDGTGVVVARFTSTASAQANNDRAEQGAWWAETEKAFSSVTFQDCTEVDTMMGGGSDDAGFVQVIEGQVKDQDSARTMMRDAEDTLADARPDILGGTICWHGDGAFTQIMYFRSEQEARSGETSPADQELDSQYRDMMAGEPTFLDLPDPQFD